MWLQESPPAWMQEAYRPRHIKYSICCSVLGGGGLPHPCRGCTPPQVPPVLTCWGGTPCLQMGYPPFWTWPGYPPSDLAGVPSHLDLAGVIPPHGIWLGYPLLPIWTCPGYCPPPHLLCTDGQRLSKHNLPVVLCTRSIKMSKWEFKSLLKPGSIFTVF